MIVLRKKRIITLLSLIVFSVIVCGTVTMKSTKSEENVENSEQIAQVVALPVSNKTIVIDAGHGVPDERRTKQ